MSYFKIKQYGAGRAFDDTCCMVLDISDLQPAVVTVKQLVEDTSATSDDSEAAGPTA